MKDYNFQYYGSEIDFKETRTDTRARVMTEEEIAEANVYTGWYKSSYTDKENRGFVSLWQQLDSYWEGNMNAAVDDSDPASNTNIIHPNVEGEVALLTDQTLTVFVAPRTPSDRPFSSTVGIILTWICERNKLIRKIDVHERRRKKFGTGIVRVMFDPHYQKDFGLPTIENANPAYVYVDPNITDIYKIEDAEFIIEAQNKSISWSRRNFDEDLVAAIMPGFDLMSDDADYFGESDGESDEKSKDNYVHLYVWFKDEDGDLVLVQCSACGIILEDSRDEETKKYFPNNRYPYFFTPMYFREGTIWGKGDAELLVNSQDIVDDLDDQIRMNARLTGNPAKLVDLKSGIDANKFTNEAGLIVTTYDVDGAKYMVPPRMPQYIIDRRKYALEYEAPRQTRFSDQMTGQPQKGVDTATEALALQQSANAGVNHKKVLFEETMSEVMEYVLDMVKEYYTEEHAFKLTDERAPFVWFKGSDLKHVPALVQPDGEFRKKYAAQNKKLPASMMLLGEDGEPMTKEAIFDLTIKMGVGMPNNPAFQYKIVAESLERQAITIEEYRRWMVNKAGLPFDPDFPMPPIPVGAAAGNNGAMPNANVQGMTAGNRPGAPI